MNLRTLIIILFLYGPTQSYADCASSHFRLTAFNTMNQNYPTGAKPIRTDSNHVNKKVYVRAKEIFSQAHKMIQKAESHIYLQTWLFQPQTTPARYVADAIKILAQNIKKHNKKPVHIWMLINVIGTQDLNAEKIRVNNFLKQFSLYSRELKFHLGFFKANFLGANHAKSISVDSKVALLTGANFSKNYNGLGYYDLGFVLKGDVVKQLDKDFVQTWRSYLKTSSFPQNWGQKITNKIKACTPILLTRNKAFSKLSDKAQESSINDTLLNSVLFAEDSVDILTPNLNVTSFMNELLQAALRGVRIRIILGKQFHSFLQTLPTRGGANKSSVRRLYQALKKHMSPTQACQVLQIRWYSEDGISAVLGAKPPTSHAKFMIVDGQTAFIGSANMDNQSWVNSREIGLFIDNRERSQYWQKNLYTPLFNKAIPVEECGGP